MNDRTSDAASHGPFPKLPALVLIWLSARRSSHAVRELNRQLYPLVERRLRSSEWTIALGEALAGLEAQGWVSRPTPKSVALTEQGRNTVLDELGVTSLPADVKWRTLLSRWLAARAMHPRGTLPTTALDRISKKQGLPVEVIRVAHKLPAPPFSTKTKVLDTLFWRQLGEERAAPFTLVGVKKLMLQRLLGSSRDQDLDTFVIHLAVKALGAPTSAELRNALIRRWLEGQDTVGQDAPAPLLPAPLATTGPVPTGALDTISEDAFVGFVQEAARTATTGRFGDRKVFIAHVYRRLAEMGHPGADIEAFKRRLLGAHKAGRLVLSPADLVQAMSKTDVSESAIRHVRSTYHFVETEARAISLPAKVK